MNTSELPTFRPSQAALARLSTPWMGVGNRGVALVAQILAIATASHPSAEKIEFINRQRGCTP